MSDEKAKPIDVSDIISPVLGLEGTRPTLGYGSRDCWRHVPEVLQLARKVQCKSCGAALDPFDVLVTITRDAQYVDQLRRERDALQTSIRELKHAEKLAKGRVRRAEAKDAAVAVAKEREKLAEMHRRFALKAEEIQTLAEQIRAGLYPGRQ